MIELLRRGPIRMHIFRISRVDAHRKRTDSDHLEHGPHEISFVFTITVGLGKHLRRRVWSISSAAPEPRLNRDVLNVLNVLTDSLNLLVLVFGDGGQLIRLSGKRVIHEHLRIFQLTHPGPYFGPIREGLNGASRSSCRRVIAHRESSHKIT